MIYPTLDYLQDQTFITITEEENVVRRLRLPLRDNAGWTKKREQLEQIQVRIKARSVGFQLRKNPQIEAGAG